LQISYSYLAIETWDWYISIRSNLKISNLLDLYDRLFHEPKTVLSIIGPDQKDFSKLNL